MNKKEAKSIKKLLKLKSSDFSIDINEIKHLRDGTLFTSTDGVRVSHFYKLDSRLHVSVSTPKGNEIIHSSSNSLVNLRKHLEVNTVISKLSSFEFLELVLLKYDIKLKLE